MIEVLEHNTEFNYKIYNFNNYCSLNKQNLLYESKAAHAKYLRYFQDNHSSTRHGSKYYNLFSLTAGYPFFYQIFKFIKFSTFDFLQNNFENLFMEAWINYDSSDEILDWHNHNEIFLCHGYLNIEPKNSYTEFKNYSIKNEIGQMYVGPSDRLHRVVVKEPFDDYRITIAFNVTNLERMRDMGFKFTNQHFSFIPL